MNITSSQQNQMKCHVQETDTIPIFVYCDEPSAFQGQLFIFCEGKHVLSYIKNPGKVDPEPSDTSQYYSTFQTKYPLFFKNAPDKIFEKFNDVFNLRQLEYWDGTSFAIRLLIETFIYSNYGTYAWHGDITLRSKSDKGKIDTVHENIKKLGFGTFMIILISGTVKKKLLLNDDEWCKRELDLEGDRLVIAKEAAKNLQSITNSGFWIGQKLLLNLKDSYNDLSPFVHSREIDVPNIKEIDISLEKVIEAYEEFYKKKNNWRIEYEQ